jgi:hypothetical protein
MRYTILLERNENIHAVELQEQSRFIKSVLEALEIPFTWNLDEPLSVDKKIDLKKILRSYNVNILNDTAGGIEIFVDKECVAKWYKPEIKLKQDVKKQLLTELNINFWIVFEDGEGGNEI